jgi:hydrogenase maturation protease
MNVSAKDHTLIIGIGNPLRSDDGLGWAVAEQLAQDHSPDREIYTVHQLTPELAQLMAPAKLVIMIDASHEGVPGELHIRPLSSPGQPGPIGTHHTSPEELAAFTKLIYNQCPPIIVVTMTGADFQLSEQLSITIAHQLPLISATVRQLCSGGT